jgi:hypothetical protein
MGTLVENNHQSAIRPSGDQAVETHFALLLSSDLSSFWPVSFPDHLRNSFVISVSISCHRLNSSAEGRIPQMQKPGNFSRVPICFCGTGGCGVG